MPPFAALRDQVTLRRPEVTHRDHNKYFLVGHLIQRTEIWTKTAITLIGAASYRRLSEAENDMVY